ncbi:MAG: hypothetical protein AB8B56_01040 [Crocinitomicaceae bacterium]
MSATPYQWEKSKEPNYFLNENLKYPYSELPFLGEYNLIKLEEQTNSNIDLVDFWGEGRIISQDGKNLISGFTNSYNINHQYQQVSNGADQSRKIPNRIPTKNYEDVDISIYIGDNTVTKITMMNAEVTVNCAKEIKRMIRKDLGLIVMYGFDQDDIDIKTLENELNKIYFYAYPNYNLPEPLNEITLPDTYIAYVNANVLMHDAKEEIKNKNYSQAKDLIKSLLAHNEENYIQRVIEFALNDYKIFPFGYELLRDTITARIVTEKFPESIKQILTQGSRMSIINLLFFMPLKVGWNANIEGDRIAYGGDAGRGIEPLGKDRFYWNLAPINDGEYFSITNVYFSTPLKVGLKADGEGDRIAYGGSAEPANKDSFYWKVTPFYNGRCFSITNVKFNTPLKVGWSVDNEGDRTAYGGDSGRGLETIIPRFLWILKPE